MKTLHPYLIVLVTFPIVLVTFPIVLVTFPVVLVSFPIVLVSFPIVLVTIPIFMVTFPISFFLLKQNPPSKLITIHPQPTLLLHHCWAGLAFFFIFQVFFLSFFQKKRRDEKNLIGFGAHTHTRQRERQWRRSVRSSSWSGPPSLLLTEETTTTMRRRRSTPSTVRL